MDQPICQGPIVQHVVQTRLPTEWGEFTLHGFSADGKEHLALTFGEIDRSAPALVRVHSECLTGDALFSQRCDCGAQLRTALASIAREGRGILLYLRQEGRGIGLFNKLRAYALQDHGADTVDANERLGFLADGRDYAVCKEMLEHFGVTKLRVMTNNPRKVAALENFGFEVVERIPLVVRATPDNRAYLSTKAKRLGHLLDGHQAPVGPKRYIRETENAAHSIE
ncbi:GTP cyclohydrolase II [Aromatoleum diolicum]|uniref:GTP cyclohydrolase-2 n=2 Tax=Aromatoleum diolicum TaxID=75796 RepID=A0ABX1Q756_9RHOO|nr:GTP cyclohydrolase II [Aromatoleum diolicum]NMG74194.1 GTP cyclohydrolase II [Aromatoleum diolicum]